MGWKCGFLLILGILVLAGMAPAQYLLDGSRDGKVDATDLVLLQNYLAGTLTLQWTPGQLVADDSIVGPLRYVPPTPVAFTQGSPTDEPCRRSDEQQFIHQLTRRLAVMETEVKRQMWADLKTLQPTLPDDPSLSWKSPGGEYPVQLVSWYEAVLFANLLSMQKGLTPCYWYRDGLLGFWHPVTASSYQRDDIVCFFDYYGFRLPTEGEWEYFCRAGTVSPFWISEPAYTVDNCSNYGSPGDFRELEMAAWFVANAHHNFGGTPNEACGSKAPNPWNLRDVHGHVEEWCWDWYGAYPADPATNYAGVSPGTERVSRGGNHFTSAAYCRSACRDSYQPGSRFETLGFRLVRTLD